MKILITVIAQTVLVSQLYCQPLLEASEGKKIELFLKAFSNQSTAPSYIVFTGSNIKSAEIKELCTLSTELWWALFIENANEANIDSLGKTYAIKRRIAFSDTNALNKINFKNYQSDRILEIEQYLTLEEKNKIAQYYNPDYQKKYLKIKKHYYKRLKKTGNKYIKKNIESINDSIVRHYIEIFKYDIIHDTYIEHVFPDINSKQREQFDAFQKNWLNKKMIIDTEYYIENPVAKYSNNFGIYFIHYLFNHGIIISEDCLGGLY